jgi:hypothetical protein
MATPSTIEIIRGITTIREIRIVIPHKRSIQLGRSFKNPSEDFISIIIPNIIKIKVGKR